MKKLSVLLFCVLFSAALWADALWLDVRTAEEYQQGHVAKAELVPHDQIVAGKVAINADKNQRVYVYCKSGNRASKAKKALEQQGFTDVINLGGWQEAERYLMRNPEQ